MNNKEIDLQLESLTKKFLSLKIDENKIIKIQKWFRGYNLRLKRLPLIMYQIQSFLISKQIKFSNKNQDGRINSCSDEDNIIKILLEKFNKRIIQPKIRMWYDILVLDYKYGWIPVNIKTTTTRTYDNTGNLAMCVYAYTDEQLILNQCYKNGEMSKILFSKLNNKKYNYNHKKDYYFIILNKKNPEDIIINSLKGLTTIKHNINNLPFQVCWNNNRIFKYEHIIKKIKLFVDCINSSQKSWKEIFITNMKTLNL